MLMNFDLARRIHVPCAELRYPNDVRSESSNLWNQSQNEGVIDASLPEARSADGCDASRSPPLVEAMTPFHKTNARF